MLRDALLYFAGSLATWRGITQCDWNPKSRTTWSSSWFRYSSTNHVGATSTKLVNGFNPSEKYESQLGYVGMILPNIWKVIKIMFQTTNQKKYCWKMLL